MTVRTQYFTFRDLSPYPRCRCTASDQVADIRRLHRRIKVVELEHKNVPLATFRARVALQELVDQLGGCSLQARLVASVPLQVSRPVHGVVSSRRLPATQTTLRVSPLHTRILEREVVRLAPLSAHTAVMGVRRARLGNQIGSNRFHNVRVSC